MTTMTAMTSYHDAFGQRVVDELCPNGVHLLDEAAHVLHTSFDVAPRHLVLLANRTAGQQQRRTKSDVVVIIAIALMLNAMLPALTH